MINLGGAVLVLSFSERAEIAALPLWPLSIAASFVFDSRVTRFSFGEVMAPLIGGDRIPNRAKKDLKLSDFLYLPNLSFSISRNNSCIAASNKSGATSLSLYSLVSIFASIV